MLGIIILTATAFILSIILVFVSSSINKNNNMEEQKIEELLPGLNCGGCGFGSCHGMACEIIKNKEAYLNCRPLRGEKKAKLEEYLNKNN